MKILVTGWNGFIGKEVIKELNKKGYNHFKFSNDIKDKDTFPKENFDIIIHLATLITHKGDYSPEELYNVNTLGTKNLLESYPSAKMIYISTIDVTKNELSNYAKTKLEAEKIVKKEENNLIIRLPSTFGPKQTQKKLIPLLFKKYCDNEKVEINNNDLREYVYVEDVAKSIVNDLDKSGVLVVEGFKIRNFDLDKMVCAVCNGEEIPNLNNEEQHFFNCLKKCLSHYQEK